MGPITLVKHTQDCSACGACLVVCPVRAITMQSDVYGSNYPKIDENRCIGCGKCTSVCAYQASSSAEPFEAYAAVGKREELVRKSASGGIFASLAESFLLRGGMVAGAVMDIKDNEADVYHLLSKNAADISRMQGSKYVQSQAWRCYKDVQKALQAGEQVLFSGTPCQVAAIKKLTGDPDNLITIDLICHGVPPLRMLNDYLQILAKKFGGTIENLVFRDKSRGKQFCARMDVDGKKGKRCIFLTPTYLSYYAYFLKGATYRENCYSCPYASLKRVSDLTIGDYWGIEQFHGEELGSEKTPNRKDWSCILINTDKGRLFLQQYKDNLFLMPTEASWVAEKNQQLNAPSIKNDRREKLLQAYAHKGYRAVESAFVKESGGWLRYYRRLIKNMHNNKNMKQ